MFEVKLTLIKLMVDLLIVLCAFNTFSTNEKYNSRTSGYMLVVLLVLACKIYGLI